jgi:dTMP kinase
MLNFDRRAMGGTLIVIEGLDGTGKHTQSELLKKYFAEEGLAVKKYAYPDYDSEYGAILERFLQGKTKKTAEELFLTYLVDMVKDRESIERDLSEGKIVVIDRYFFSTVAYQSAGGFDHEKGKLLQNIVALPKPDLAIYFKVPVAVSMARKKRQRELQKDRQDEFERNNAFLERAEFFYEKMISEGFGAKKWLVISAEGGVDEVHARVIESLRPALAKAQGEVLLQDAHMHKLISDKKD